MSQIAFKLRQMVQKMWFLPAAFSLVAILTVVIAYATSGLVPDKLPFTLSSEAVESILTVLASSLLTVAVFSLSTIVSALSSASASTTPRAVPLIVGDRSAQTSISVFIGAFLFSIVGIIGLSANIYSEAGRLLLFAVTLAVVVLVVAALIRWIGQMSSIGRVGETVSKVGSATEKAFRTVPGDGLLGCRRLSGKPSGEPVFSRKTGYVQHVDLSRLQELAEQHELLITITSRPGAYAAPDRPLMLVAGTLEDDMADRLAGAFTVGTGRTFDSDPRFGLIVLAEIGSKALSPGINDPGTAIAVVSTLVRVLAERPVEDSDLKYERLLVAPLDPDDLMADSFRPIARDGAGSIEVMLRMVAGLKTLARCRPEMEKAAKGMIADAVERGLTAMSAKSDKAALKAAGTLK
ncbi:putative membrane protein [Devosia subaequoris]|uniref:Putative membrane protein n=1 Tax=Devosia subaequoris TaxID=395930 RepID=A0A7W6IK15_9HYPH|nr:DUF2254 domain-containing protein [Devosia subaequoris]MBB4051063.1 putative membrane protein [Devosia subaequoris]MCP1208270.1 DUF2254 domain-containing protein [Devosia subaequoris]